MVSGRYEGIDERVIEKYAHEVFSVGEYILTGGELPSLIMSDAISRNVEGVLGNMDSLTDESYNQNEEDLVLLEAPSFTKPVEFRGLRKKMKNKYIAAFEAAQVESKEIPLFRAGDTLRLGVEIKEGT
ncbi:tRNA (guanine-N1-)-methyltransferase, bacteria like protein, partial [Aduncisulcus paluster]